ncbi:MAG: PBP1A family penicillin-binding protein [Desulfobacterales bacterium]
MIKRKSNSRILEKRTRRKQRGVGSKIGLILILLFIILTTFGSLTVTGYYYYLQESLPKITSLKDYLPPIITMVYSDDGRKIAEFYKERREIVTLSETPQILIDAFVAAEDARFFKHEGIDFLSVVRAMFKNIEAGTIVQGGSTITQQVTKSFFLTPERSYTRKIKEAILSYRIDKKFTKDEILFLYLNQIYLGHGAYGIQAAAQNYFGKPVQELNLAECAVLAGLPQAPSKYSPFRFPERARKRQIYVLNRMLAEEYITNIQATEAINTKLDIKPKKNWYIEEAPWYTEHVRRYVEKQYGPEALYKDGLKIYTAVNVEMQQIAKEEIDKGLRQLDKRMGYRGPLMQLPPEKIEGFAKELQADQEKPDLEAGDITRAIVIAVDNTNNLVTIRLGNGLGRIQIEDMAWARKPNQDVDYRNARIKQPGEALQVGDVIHVQLKGKSEEEDLWECALEQLPVAQSALLCIEGETGHVKAMIGGRSFRKSQFNRAIQSRRQPGSAFKPVIYSAALDKNYTAATEILDTPIVFKDIERDFTWKPKNYEEKFFGPTLFREALEKSHNIVTIKILKDIGVDYVIDYARRLGIQSNLNRDLSIALGSSGVSLLEIVSAYSVFSNLGNRVEPIFITKIVDRDGVVLEENLPAKERVIEKSTAYIMTNLLEGVVKHGTGRKIRALKRPVAGKTGTTNNLFDAWFVGYTPGYVTGTWVGFDEEQSLGKGETGSRAASPIWLGFMGKILKDKPVRVFQVPEGVVFSKIDAETGKLPIPESKKTIFECFKEGTVPTEYTKKPGSVTEAEQFFKNGI